MPRKLMTIERDMVRQVYVNCPASTVEGLARRFDAAPNDVRLVLLGGGVQANLIAERVRFKAAPGVRCKPEPKMLDDGAAQAESVKAWVKTKQPRAPYVGLIGASQRAAAQRRQLTTPVGRAAPTPS